ncbi:MAG: ABC transporter ATP-binding protein [Crenarchaeota archaeon]|nr:ABC transporter ATP-binding protein [Thermoproteota archaeon]
MLPQDAALDSSLTPLDHVSTYLRIRGYDWRYSLRRAKEVLSSVGLDSYARTPCLKLSGGMRRLVLIATVLAPEGVEAIFLDEPSAGLDPLNANRMWSLIKERVREGVRILVTSHILHSVEEHVPEVILLNRGRVVAKGDSVGLVNQLEKYVARIDVASTCSRVASLLGRSNAVFKCVDVGSNCVLFVDRQSLEKVLRQLASSVELSVRKIDLECVFLWYVH